MSDYLKKCNCGGNAQILSEWSKREGTDKNYWIMCNKCGICTKAFDDKEKAIATRKGLFNDGGK